MRRSASWPIGSTAIAGQPAIPVRLTTSSACRRALALPSPSSTRLRLGSATPRAVRIAEIVNHQQMTLAADLAKPPRGRSRTVVRAEPEAGDGNEPARPRLARNAGRCCSQTRPEWTVQTQDAWTRGRVVGEPVDHGPHRGPRLNDDAARAVCRCRRPAVFDERRQSDFCTREERQAVTRLNDASTARARRRHSQTPEKIRNGFQRAPGAPAGVGRSTHRIWCERLEATNPPDDAVVDQPHQVRMAKSVERGAPVGPALLILRNVGDVQADRRARTDVDTRTCRRREKTIRDEGHVFARRWMEPARRQPGAPCALNERQRAKATRGAAKTSYRIPVRWCDFSQPANRTGRRWW